MEEYNIEVNGKLVHVRKTSPTTALVTIPAGSRRQQRDPLTGRCYFGEKLSECSCEPWNCPARVESWMQERDHFEEKLFNITPAQRDLSFLKARLTQRCATNHSKRRNPNPNPGEAKVIARVKRRTPLKPSLTPLQRLRRSHVRTKKLRVLPPSKDIHNTRSTQIKRQIQKRVSEHTPPEPGEGSEREATIGGLFEKIEVNEPRFASFKDMKLVEKMKNSMRG